MAEDSGWIKLHRALLDGPIIQHAGMLQVWIHCLLRANWESRRIMFPGCLTPILIERGEFVTGRNSLHATLYPRPDKDNPAARTVWRWLEALEAMECVKCRTVSNRCTIVTVVNYETYQAKEPGQCPADVPPVSRPCPADVPPVSRPCPADVPPVSTDKELKNLRIKEELEKRNAGEPQVFIAPRLFCITPGITSIEIDGNVIEYHENAWSWEAEFVRRWNLLPKVNKRTSSSLDETLRKALQQRLMDVSWFWKRAMGLFPLPTDLDWTPTLTWFLKPDSVSKILDGNFQRVTKRKPTRSAEDDEFVSFTEEELSK